DLAFDLSLAALLGDNIYNFGELLAHPIIKSLLGTRVEWLYYILQAFNSGDLVRYQELCVVHQAALSAQPALVQNERKLLEKINILCLMEIIFSRPAEDRTIPLSIIAERTRLSVEDVELLLMKSLSVFTSTFNRCSFVDLNYLRELYVQKDVWPSHHAG
ncbi:hypothetical protein MKW94_026295, partial [Papaver nudicaule]|nr:hypothetical protein [Papaver nudicaule]